MNSETRQKSFWLQLGKLKGLRFMALREKFCIEVQKYISNLTGRKQAVILDAATGAGETTLQIAQVMKGGKLITVDCDVASWDEWAQPILKTAGVIEHVEFLHADIRNLSSVVSNAVDLVVSDATLSTLSIWAVDALKEFHRVLKTSGRLVLADLLPESETESDSTNIAVLDWRLAKAAAHLSGKEHYEELPTDWVKARLVDIGFEIIDFRIDRSRIPARDISYNEWREIDLAVDIPEKIMRETIDMAHNAFIRRAEKEGLTTKTGIYNCWARKI